MKIHLFYMLTLISSTVLFGSDFIEPKLTKNEVILNTSNPQQLTINLKTEELYQRVISLADILNSTLYFEQNPVRYRDNIAEMFLYFQGLNLAQDAKEEQKHQAFVAIVDLLKMQDHFFIKHYKIFDLIFCRFFANCCLFLEDNDDINELAASVFKYAYVDIKSDIYERFFTFLINMDNKQDKGDEYVDLFTKLKHRSTAIASYITRNHNDTFATLTSEQCFYLVFSRFRQFGHSPTEKDLAIELKWLIYAVKALDYAKKESEFHISTLSNIIKNDSSLILFEYVNLYDTLFTDEQLDRLVNLFSDKPIFTTSKRHKHTNRNNNHKSKSARDYIRNEVCKSAYSKALHIAENVAQEFKELSSFYINNDLEKDEYFIMTDDLHNELKDLSNQLKKTHNINLKNSANQEVTGEIVRLKNKILETELLFKNIKKKLQKKIDHIKMEGLSSPSMASSPTFSMAVDDEKLLSPRKKEKTRGIPNQGTNFNKKHNNINIENNKNTDPIELDLSIFKDKFTRIMYQTECVGNYPINTIEYLTVIVKANSFKDLEILPSGCKSEKLKGKWKGYWSVRINDEYRITFKPDPNDARFIEIEASKHYDKK